MASCLARKIAGRTLILQQQQQQAEVYIFHIARVKAIWVVMC